VISWGRADHCGDPADFTYDLSSTDNLDSTFDEGHEPYTRPAGYSAANSFGLYDIAGNVLTWNQGQIPVPGDRARFGTSSKFLGANRVIDCRKSS